MDASFQHWINEARAVPLLTEAGRRGLKLKRVGLEQVGPCPKCGGDDRFAINPKKSVFNCRGCGIKGDVIELVQQLDGVDFNAACTRLTGHEAPKKANGKAGAAVKKVVTLSRDYHNADGSIAFAVDRIQFQKSDGSFALKNGKPDKIFKQRRPDRDQPGQWIHNKDGCPVVPYRLPEVLEAIATGHAIAIVEGEAKADLLWSWNVPATCNAGGAKKWTRQHSEFLRGADVLLFPDEDGVGWEHIQAVGVSLKDIAKRVRVVALKHAKAKDDIIDWANNGGTREQLDEAINAAADFVPLTDEEIDKHVTDEQAAAKNHEDELLAALAKAKPGLEYHRKREEAIKDLKATATAIEAEVKRRREAEPLYSHWTIEPWPDPVDGDSLLRDLVQRILSHIVCSHDDALIIALWVMFSWVHDEVAIHSPILLITSAQPECGKTTTLNLVSFLAPRALASVEISRAALYRSIQLWRPSFIIDEFDNVLSSKDGDAAELRSVINSGHTKGQGVVRCITDDHRPELFPTFAPKALGMVDRKLPPATLSRCIIVELRRRTKTEPVVRFKNQDDAGLADLRRRLCRWSADNGAVIKDEPPMPPDFDNRRADNWRVLFGISDLCDGVEGWAGKARIAAIASEGASDTTSIGVRLLTDIKRIFDQNNYDAILSAALVSMLKEDAEAPWIDWNKGKGLTQNSLAYLLSGGGGRGRASRGGFGIHSGDVHPSPSVHGRGYKRSQFEEAWKRYLPAPEIEDPPV
jgi:uncharacterized protein DUF3631/CHC2-type zinc finger protein